MLGEELLAEAQPSRHAIIHIQCWLSSARRAQVRHDTDISAIAHEEERRDVAQDMGQSAQRGQGPLTQLCALVAQRAQGDEVGQLIGGAVVVTLPLHPTKGAKGSQMVDIVLATRSLGSAAVLAATAIANPRPLPLLSPIGAAVA